jgi:hypothetical protein
MTTTTRRFVLAAGLLLAALLPALPARAQLMSVRLPGDSMGPYISTGDSLGTAYHNGVVLSNPQIVAVFWGPSVNTTVTSQIGGFYSAWLAASNMGWMCEYNTPTQSIGAGSFAGNFTITPINTATSLTDAAVQTELAAQINAGHLPPPNANILYMVHFPPGVTITDPFGDVSCVDFCGYHYFANATIGGAPFIFPYAILPDFGPAGGCGGCGDRSLFDNFSKTASHEISEAITDTRPFTGWVLSGGAEIGDVCNFGTLGDAAYYNFTSGGTTYAAQKEWSHDSDACIVGGPCTACNPFVSTCHTTVEPDVLFTGPLFYAVQSSGCSGPGPAVAARSCTNSVTLSPGTTILQKCNLLVSGINSACGSQNFHADNTNCAGGTFTVTDLACNAQTPVGTGTSLLLASGSGTLQGSGMLNDYEQDTITNGCQAGGGDSMVMLAGSPTGAAINGNQSSVIFVVTTPFQGTVIQTILTSKNMTAASIVSQAVSNANLALAALQSNVRCAVEPLTPTLARCTVGAPAPTGTGGGSGTDGLPATNVGVPVTFQVNDTGMTRTVMSGPSKDVQVAVQTINAQGGIPSVLAFNSVGGTACSPCQGVSGPNCCKPASPLTVPALGGPGTAGLALALASLGALLARRFSRARRRA